MFAAVLRIADQAVADWIDDKIEQFERNLADQNGNVIGDFQHVESTVPALNCQTNRAVDLNSYRSAGGSDLPGSK